MVLNLFHRLNQDLTKINIDGETYLTNPGIQELTPKYILGFSYGPDIDRHSYNFQLAKTIKTAGEYFKNRDIPVLSQEQVGICLRRLNFGFSYEDHTRISRFKILERMKMDSINQVLAKQKYILEKHNFDLKSALFIAHPKSINKIISEANKIGIHGNIFMKAKVDKTPRTYNKPYLENHLIT